MSQVPNVPGPTEDKAWWKRWWVWAIVGAVVIVLVVVAVSAQGSSKNGGGMLLLFGGSNNATVPNIVGMTGADAARTVQAAGFTIGQTSQVESTGVAPGTVISQTPAAGVEAAKGSAISAVQAKGASAVPVPNVTGMSSADATAALVSAGLVPVVQQDYNNTVASGVVISQVPAAGTQAAPQSQVAVIVSKGKQPSQVSVPNVTGKSEADAKSAIQAAGLVAVVNKASSSSVASGKVSGQVPSAGSKVNKGSEVGIIVSTGAAPASAVSVPNVVGKTDADAKSAIEGAGLVAVKYSGYSDTVAAGLVVQQLPAAGAKVNKGTQVGYEVSLGKAATGVKVPNVVGMTQDAASSAIKGAGLVPVVVENWSETVATGKVIVQLPDAGVSVSPGSSVAISVSKGPEPVVTPY